MPRLTEDPRPSEIMEQAYARRYPAEHRRGRTLTEQAYQTAAEANGLLIEHGLPWRVHVRYVQDDGPQAFLELRGAEILDVLRALTRVGKKS